MGPLVGEEELVENLDTLREVAPVKTFSSWKMIDRVRAIGGRFTLRRKRLLEDASTYRGEAVVFERLSSVVKEAGFAPEVVMATALRLQDLHNRQDIKWLEELGVQRD